MLRDSMRRPSLISTLTGAVLVLSAPAFASDKAFDETKFSFAFSYDPTWIPAVQAEGESVTFTLSEGEVHVAVQRDPNPRQHKTRAALAGDLIRTWKGRLAFDKLEPVETKLGGVPATLVQGTGRLFDEKTPYRLALYVIERDGKLYVVKYSGLFDPSRGFWDGFTRLTRSFRFREPGAVPAPIPTTAKAPVPAMPTANKQAAAVPTPGPVKGQSSAE